MLFTILMRRAVVWWTSNKSPSKTKKLSLFLSLTVFLQDEQSISRTFILADTFYRIFPSNLPVPVFAFNEMYDLDEFDDDLFRGGRRAALLRPSYHRRVRSEANFDHFSCLRSHFRRAEAIVFEFGTRIFERRGVWLSRMRENFSLSERWWWRW